MTMATLIAVNVFDVRLQLKIGTSLTCELGNVYTNFDFSIFFCFQVTSSYGTDRRTDTRTDKTLNAAYKTVA